MQGDRSPEVRSISPSTTRRNELAVQVAVDCLALPVAKLRPAEDVVHVVVLDTDDLNRWHYELGGEITAMDAGDGVALWTLLTNSPERGDGSTVPIHVHAVIPEGDDVVIEVRRFEVSA